MAKNVTYDKAIVEADRVERRERRRAGDVRKATHGGRQLPDPKAVHDRLWKKLESGIEVWIVNGRLVRSVFDIDFTAGGHDHVYEFVPQGEVWIDDAIEEKPPPSRRAPRRPCHGRVGIGRVVLDRSDYLALPWT